VTPETAGAAGLAVKGDKTMRKFLALLSFVLLSSTALAGDTNFVGRVIVQDGYDAPTCSTASGEGMLCVEQAVELQSTLAVAGATTLTGATTQTGALTVTGALTANGGIVLGGAVTGAAQTLTGQLAGTFEDFTQDAAVDATDCGAIVSTNDDGRIFTLPAVAAGNLACVITFVNTAADGQADLVISPNANDGIYGSCVGVTGAGAATVAQLSGTDDADIGNTQATQNKGDYITLASDGSTGWYVTGCVGVWTNP
jgi:hypothetical protein